MGSSHHSGIIRLPHGLARCPGSLLANAYGPSGFYSSPTGTKTSSRRNSHDGASGRRDSGRQRNSLDEKKAEPVIVIEVDEGKKSSLQTTVGAEKLERCRERPQDEGTLCKRTKSPSLYTL